MRNFLVPALMVLAVFGFSAPAKSATVTLSGTITLLSVLGYNTSYTTAPEVVVLQLTTQPTATGCKGGTAFFSFSPSSITDANTRRNLLATLLTARAAGLTVTVAYDNAGAYCDIGPGYAVPYQLSL
jgi:hypothetical protein